jgi:sigma-E factor negative regulatory protein RseC
MERTNGRIFALDGTSATVEVDTRLSCPRCASGNGCGAALLQGEQRTVQLQIDLPPGITPSVGDTIGLAISPVYLLNAALIAYGLPLIGMVLFAGLSRWVTGDGSELVSIAAAVAGLVVGLLLGRNLMKNRRLCREFKPEFDGMGGNQVV